MLIGNCSSILKLQLELSAFSDIWYLWKKYFTREECPPSSSQHTTTTVINIAFHWGNFVQELHYLFDWMRYLSQSRRIKWKIKKQHTTPTIYVYHIYHKYKLHILLCPQKSYSISRTDAPMTPQPDWWEILLCRTPYPGIPGNVRGPPHQHCGRPAIVATGTRGFDRGHLN